MLCTILCFLTETSLTAVEDRHYVCSGTVGFNSALVFWGFVLSNGWKQSVQEQLYKDFPAMEINVIWRQFEQSHFFTIVHVEGDNDCTT